MEVYIDGMVVKLEKAADHMRHLAGRFNTLREYKMKLNPSKCAFGVSSGKFLGYIVTQRGIEALTSDGSKSVQNLESPEKPKDVQRLAGKVAALSRFISRSSDKCKLFYDILRKSQKFEWTADHEQAFRELKHYLSSPPLLSKPEPGEPLFLYLAVTEVAVSAVLVREQDKEKKPFYYVSKYDPRTTIKSQALADFVSDFSPAIQNLADEEILTLKGNKEAEVWQMHIDEAFNQRGAEYEALILGMQLALEPGVRNLQIFSDSLLIVNHVNDEFIVRDSKMIAYLKVAKELKQKFKDCKLKQIPRDQNMEADALATLGETFKPTELSNISIAHMLEPSIQKLEEADRGELEDQQDKLAVQITIEGQITSQPNDQTADQAAGQSPDQPATQADDWDWRTPYLDWLRHGKLPDDKKEIRGFKMKASKLILIDDILFRQPGAGPYLRCLDKQEAQTVLHALHNGECGNHARGMSLSNKALRQGYTWPTMRADSIEYARKCDACQRSTPMIHQPA
ncbi:uncharacterized protein LOC141618032 [Silene latifolia]|uniref:uncharacterized protein LOC141618032 n=1 Tax=Silene latifolia TaxID=37657 RepID=UPI003D778F50